MRRLETRLGIRLLNRTTRHVAPTEAGEKLAATLRPSFDKIEAQIAALGVLREKPAGLVRITSSAHAASSILWPVIAEILPDYPDLKFEVNVESRLTDIVTDRFDAGVRLGESLDRDMIAVRIGPNMPMAVVGAPDYFARRGIPEEPGDLEQHACINLRLPTLGGLYAWEFQKAGRAQNVRVDGPLIFNTPDMCLKAALAGHGLACLLADHAATDLKAGRLRQVLQDWCAPFVGYHLYYPSRRQLSPAMTLLVERLRYRG